MAERRRAPRMRAASHGRRLREARRGTARARREGGDDCLSRGSSGRPDRERLTEACGNSESGTDAHTSEKLRSTPGTAGARLELAAAASPSRSRMDQILSLSFFTSTFFAAVANLRRGSHM